MDTRFSFRHGTSLLAAVSLAGASLLMSTPAAFAHPERETSILQPASEPLPGPEIELPEASIVEDLDIDTPDSLTVLVNKARPYEERDYEPENLVELTVPSVATIKLRDEAAEAAEALFDVAEEDGIPMLALSGYRSYDHQVATFNSVASANGESSAENFSARPGYSEHQSGLALDVTDTSRTCDLKTCFADTEAGQWLADNAHKFGFIIRYPEDSHHVTGYHFEPWHIRYLGEDVATDVFESEMLYEEYAEVEPAPTYVH